MPLVTPTLLPCYEEFANDKDFRLFHAKFNKAGANECWLWTACTIRGNYGLNKKIFGEFVASRISYMLYKGRIPKGLFVLHKCDTPNCVNPNHLFLGTQADNMKDMVEKGRSLTGEKNPLAKLTEESILEMRKIWDEESPKLKPQARPPNSRTGLLRRIGEQFGVTWQCVYVVCVSRKNWAHLIPAEGK